MKYVEGFWEIELCCIFVCFVRAYEEVEGDYKKLRSAKAPEDHATWDIVRNKELAPIVKEIKDRYIQWFETDEPMRGLPTKEHTRCIMWAFSYEPAKLKKTLPLLKEKLTRVDWTFLRLFSFLINDIDLSVIDYTKWNKKNIRVCFGNNICRQVFEIVIKTHIGWPRQVAQERVCLSRSTKDIWPTRGNLSTGGTIKNAKLTLFSSSFLTT